jgi:pimeloyl-ACP methyl ester carboxylesterase
LALAALAAGCSTRPAPACSPDAASLGASPVCFVTSDGWTLQGVEWGNASATRAAILVHGLNEDHHSYDALGPELASRGWRVLAFDSRGMGQSAGRGGFRNFTAQDFAAMDRDVDAARAALPAADRVAVVGASVGSSEALRWSDRADRSAPLVLLSPGLGYQDVEVLPAVRDHVGPALALVSTGDAYSDNSVTQMQPEHLGPFEVHRYDGTLHGTQQLSDSARRALIEAWLDANLTN